MTAQTHQNLPDEEALRPPQRYRHLHKICTTHPCIHGFMFISILTLDLAEMTNDWLLFIYVSVLQQGLVYGPLNMYIVVTLHVACAVGTLTFTFEILNTVIDVFSGKPWVDMDLVSAIIVWSGDIPMIVINLMITLCYSEPISYFQLTKALLVIMSVILRIVAPLMRAYMKQNNESENEGFRKYIYKVVTMIGLCLMLCGSVCIFIFTHVIATDEQKLKFRMPQDIWGGKFPYDKYFRNVAIYFHPNDLRFDLHNNADEFWIRLANIHEFLDSDSIHVHVQYVEQNRVIQKLVVSSYNTTSLRYYECYVLKKYQNNTSVYEFANSVSFMGENPEKIVFKFVFVPPKNHLILGDITYTAKFVQNSICYDLASNKTVIFRLNKNSQILMGKLLYFKHETEIHEDRRLVQRNPLTSLTITHSNNHLYDTADFLLAIENVWKTGMYGCECTGKLGPTMNESLKISC